MISTLNLCYGLYRSRNGFNNRLYKITKLEKCTAPPLQNLILMILGYKYCKVDFQEPFNFSTYAITRDDLSDLPDVRIRILSKDLYLISRSSYV